MFYMFLHNRFFYLLACFFILCVCNVHMCVHACLHLCVCARALVDVCGEQGCLLLEITLNHSTPFTEASLAVTPRASLYG